MNVSIRVPSRSRVEEVKDSYLVVSIFFLHSPLTLFLCNDLARILYNDLAGLESAARSNTKPFVDRLDQLYAHVVLVASLVAFFQVGETSVLAELGADVAVAVIALVEHISVLTVFIAAGFLITDAAIVSLRHLETPISSSNAYKAI